MVRVVFVLIAVALFSQSDISIPQTFGCTPSDGQTGCKPCLTPGEPGKEKENKWPDVTDLELDKTELRFLQPKAGESPDYSREMTISVKTTAIDAEGDVLTYNYTVTAGRIVGTGANVTWDLNRVMPGTYTITAAVDDGCGLCGTKVTRTVTILNKDSGCICRDIRIYASPRKTRSGDIIIAVDMLGPVPSGLMYNWTLTEGRIVSGQGTSRIVVSPPQEQTRRPRTATVEVSGLDDSCQCPNTASRTY